MSALPLILAAKPVVARVLGELLDTREIRIVLTLIPKEDA